MRYRPAAARATRSGRGITSASSGSRPAPSSACRTSGWPGWGSRRTRTRSTSTAPTRWTIRRTRSPNPRIDGGTVLTATGGSGKSGIYLVLPQYQFYANGLYQGPWGLNFGANWLYRQGYAEPYYRSNVATTDTLSNNKSVLAVSNVTDFRLPAVSSLDARVEKAFKIQRANIMLDLDIFNIFNNATVLGRQYDIRRTGPTGYNQVLEIMNPRILRLGARVNF